MKWAGAGRPGDLRRDEASGMTGVVCLAGRCDEARQGAEKRTANRRERWGPENEARVTPTRVAGYSGGAASRISSRGSRRGEAQRNSQVHTSEDRAR